MGPGSPSRLPGRNVLVSGGHVGGIMKMMLSALETRKGGPFCLFVLYQRYGSGGGRR